ncbi:MAG: hypothetical protein ACFCUI_05015 [Bernardetiaceae bacterium]
MTSRSLLDTDALPWLFAGETLFYAEPQHQAVEELLAADTRPQVWVQTLPEGEVLEMLTKLLQALELSLDQVRLLITPDENKPTHILHFGAETPDYLWQMRQDSRYLAAHSLEEIAVQVPLKRRLWAALKDESFLE